MKLNLYRITNGLISRNEQRGFGSPLLLASIIYIVSNILILFVDGVFWDDWCIYNNSIGLKQITDGVGATWQYPLHASLMTFSEDIGINVMLFYRALIFIFGLLDVFLFYSVVNQYFKSQYVSYYATILFAAWPLGYSHMMICCFVYQLGFFFQLISLLLISKVLQNSNIFLSILIIVSQFLASLCLQSTIVFWFGVLFVITVIKNYSRLEYSILCLKFLLKDFLFVLFYFTPCIVYWGLRLLYWMPTGEYASSGYNHLSIGLLLNSFSALSASIVETGHFIFVQISNVFCSPLVLVVVLVIFIGLLLYAEPNKNNESNPFKRHLFLLLIIYVFSIGAYVLVGKTQTYGNLGDRHGILLTLSIMPGITYIVFCLIRRSICRHVVMLFLVSVFIVNSLYQYVVMIEASQKNDAIMSFFKEQIIPDGNISVVDNTPYPHFVPFYAWSGMYRYVSNKQDRCFSAEDGTFLDGQWFLSEMYNQKDAKPGNSKCVLIISSSLNYTLVLKNVLHKIINTQKYNDNINKTYRIALVGQ